jgi:hypothetical protein
MQGICDPILTSVGRGYIITSAMHLMIETLYTLRRPNRRPSRCLGGGVRVSTDQRIF